MKENVRIKRFFLTTLMMVIACVGLYVDTVFATNTNMSSATWIDFGKVYSDSITEDIDKRYYKIVLSSSAKVSFDINGNNKYLYFSLYDRTGEFLDGNSFYKSSVKNSISIQEQYYLTAGTYYFSLEGDSKIGEYQLKLEMMLSDESFPETQEDNDNDITCANNIGIGKIYKAQIAYNDTIDFYRFVVSSSGKVSVSVEGENSIIYGYLYDSDGKQLDKEYESLNSVTNKLNFTKEFHLAAGTYYYAVEGYNNYVREGNYQLQLNFVNANESFPEEQKDDYISGANPICFNTTYCGQVAFSNDLADYYKLIVKKKDTIQIDVSADMGGELHIYDPNGKSLWYKGTNTNSQSGKREISQIVTIATGTYYIRFKEYYDTGNYLFKISSYNETTKPAKVTLSSVKSTKKKKATIKWKKTSNVNGYQIQYAKSKKFKNGRTITVGEYTSKKTIKKLSSRKKYYVRIRAYKNVVGKKKYGSWSKVKSVKIK